MNSDDILKLIRTKRPEVVLERLAAIPQAERRKHGKDVARFYGEALQNRKTAKSFEAVQVGVLATATLTDLKKLLFHPIPTKFGIENALRTLSPEWIDAWVAWVVENSPHWIARIAPVWEAGLCARPTSDAFILGYYATYAQNRDLSADDMFLDHDVWRFFEVEGGGEFSLAAHDKYASPDCSWATQLVALVNAGKLDRDRMLDATLEALARDFAQFRAGWYARFHTALNPTPEEIAKRAERYLSLLGSSIPTTVSFAIKIVQALDKAQEIAPGDLLEALDGPLQARQKGTVVAALRLIASAVKRDPTLSEAATRKAICALVSEQADVQSKALDLIERLDAPAIQDALAQYVPLVAPSVQARIATMAGISHETPQAGQAIAQTSIPQQIMPVADAAEALTVFLAVLEVSRDPFEVERAIDGIARFGVKLTKDAKLLSPLKKRARQIWNKPGENYTRVVLAATGSALAEGTAVHEFADERGYNPSVAHVPKGCFARVFRDRNAEIIERIQSGFSLPMLSEPTDTGGFVNPVVLMTRLEPYRAAGVAPGMVDLSLALLRLSTDNRETARVGFVPKTEEEHALAYALGSDACLGSQQALWAAAWAARQPCPTDPHIVALFDRPHPDCGIAAEYDVSVARIDRDIYRYIDVRIAEPLTITEDTKALPAMFHVTGAYGVFACSGTYEDVAWASLVRPGWPEPFFRSAIARLDPDQKLTDHPCLGFLEPFFRPGPPCGPLGAATLVYYMASEDKSVSGLACEAVATLFAEDRLEVALFAQALKPFVLADALPTKRWTKGLGTIAQTAPQNATLVREAMVAVLDFTADDTPHDFGGMLELLYELSVASQTTSLSPQAEDCLRGIRGGGKLAKFSKKLLQMAQGVEA
ncbi:DUF6493 family protein [uncultured Roseobacter sp.]|uniref:DUF6493 family protein n=1 Tax=uncultured Roseobacter sp. TaxID=114847 RepID=UPI0026049EE6|nr:DUF6493 family protein [uncultured Roseobacter sp.]